MVAHTDSVSSVCIGNEEYQLLSCSHDGSFRCWDIRKYKLLFDVPAHRKKNDEGCLSIIPNSTYQVIITSGADGLVKIFKNS
jgi:WD40 repeat protein